MTATVGSTVLYQPHANKVNKRARRYLVRTIINGRAELVVGPNATIWAPLEHLKVVDVALR